MDNTDNEHFMLQLQTELDRLSSQQEELADNRQQVLIERQRLVSSSKLISKHRDRAGNAEAQLMDTFRKYFTNLGPSLPDELTLAYSEVEKIRNELVVAEDSHAELVQVLEISEWTLTEQEEDLYQRDLSQLLRHHNFHAAEETVTTATSKNLPRTNSFAPSAAVRYQVDMLQHRQLVRRFHSLSRNRTNTIEHISRLSIETTFSMIERLDQSCVEQNFSDTLDKLIKREVEVKHSKANLGALASTSIAQIPARSEPDLSSCYNLQSCEVMYRSRSDGGSQHAGNDIVHPVSIEEWMLDCLRGNLTEKMYYMSILRHEMGTLEITEFDHWEEEIIHSWSSNAHPLGVPHISRQFLVDSKVDASAHVYELLNSVGQWSDSGLHDCAPQKNQDMVFSRGGWIKPSLAQVLQPDHQPLSFRVNDSSLVDNQHRLIGIGDEADDTLTELSVEPESFTFPELRITAPENQYEQEHRLILLPEELSAVGDVLPRCDSAQNSDPGQQQHAEMIVRGFPHPRETFRDSCSRA